MSPGCVDEGQMSSSYSIRHRVKMDEEIGHPSGKYGCSYVCVVERKFSRESSTFRSEECADRYMLDNICMCRDH